MDDVPLKLVHRLIEPGPIVLVTTAHEERANIMTMGFHMMVQHEPPLIGCVIGLWDYSYKALRATKECVIAVPTVDLARKVVDIGNCTGEEIDKFAKFRLTTAPAKFVQAPLIAECLANLECRVADTRLVSQYSLFVLEVVKGWIDSDRKEQRTLHHKGNGTFAVDGRTVDLRSRMTKWQEYQ
jgi:flavin reductase (DIM6/NTAB) family NADH-FMN oxidoreductase RutF